MIKLSFSQGNRQDSWKDHTQIFLNGKKNFIGAFYQTVGVQKERAQVVKSIDHEFLITQYKNHSRYTILSRT